MNTKALLVSNIKIALQKNQLYCTIPYTTFNFQILNTLLKEGYLYAIHVIESPEKIKKNIIVKFKYYHNKSVLKYIKLISRPGKKTYWSYKKLKYNLSSHKNKKILVSTSLGVISSDQALNEQIGGEIIFEYY